jgi:hypothetical protein
LSVLACFAAAGRHLVTYVPAGIARVCREHPAPGIRIVTALAARQASPAGCRPRPPLRTATHPVHSKKYNQE